MAAEEITFCESKSNYIQYQASKKLKSGYTAIISFDKWGNDFGDVWYNVRLASARKRKSSEAFILDGGPVRESIVLQKTGDGSIEALLFAKEAIRQFIDRIEVGHMIYVGAEDSQRFRVYQRGLRDLGFRKFSNENVLIYRKEN